MATLILDATNKSIVVTLSGTVATTQPDFTAAYADNTGTAFTEGANDGATNNTTEVTVVAAPASATRRIIKYITIENRDTASITFTLSYKNNTTLRTIAQVTLASGDTWTTEGAYDTTGALKSTVGNATSSTNIGITNDTSTNATMYPTWVTGTTGFLPARVTSTKLTFNPSTGILTATGGISGGTF